MSEKMTGTRGGQRLGAGRKHGTGKFGEPTESIRVPVSLLPVVRAWVAGKASAPPEGSGFPAADPKRISIPYFSSKVPAGLPSAADDHVEDIIDLNERLVDHPGATFMVRVHGESMIDAGIFDGDLLIVDRSLEPKPGAIVVAVVNGELTVKRLRVEKGRVWLMPENPAFQPLAISDEMELVIWGVVAHAVRSF